MKAILLTNLFALLFTFNGYSQEKKVTIKENLVSVNGSPVFILFDNDYPMGYTLYNLKNEKLAVLRAYFYSDNQQVTVGNPQGRVGYFDVTFLNENMDKCEIGIVGGPKLLAKLIVFEELVKDEKLNESAVKQFCRINGTKFSEYRKQ